MGLGDQLKLGKASLQAFIDAGKAMAEMGEQFSAVERAARMSLTLNSCKACGIRTGNLSGGGFCAACNPGLAPSKLAGMGCRACRQLKPSVDKSTGICAGCAGWAVRLCTTTPKSTSEAVELIQTIMTREGRMLGAAVAPLGWVRGGGETDEAFRERILDVSRWPVRGDEVPGVTKSQFSNLTGWDEQWLEVHTKSGPLHLELDDFHVQERFPETEFGLGIQDPAMQLVWALPKDTGGDPPELHLPQRLIGARVVERDHPWSGAPSARLLMLTVGLAAIEEPKDGKPPLQARDRVTLVTGWAEPADESWTEIGVVSRTFEHKGIRYVWRYRIGADGKPMVTVLVTRDELADEELSEQLAELGAEQFAACVLGEVEGIPVEKVKIPTIAEWVGGGGGGGGFTTAATTTAGGGGGKTRRL